MIVTEEVIKYGLPYKHTYSDQNLYIYCPDDTVGDLKVLFKEALDPVDSPRQYLELIEEESDELTPEEALNIIVGGE